MSRQDAQGRRLVVRCAESGPGRGASPIGWVIAQEVHLDAAAVETTCTRYVDLVAHLLAEFQ